MILSAGVKSTCTTKFGNSRRQQKSLDVVKHFGQITKIVPAYVLQK